jgi:molybdopterin/thiamine biosynthesis adenylyltransferase
LASRVLICGCGALGTVLANTLARAGVGFLRIIDRDFIERNNLQRQVLFDEDDIAAELPKAVAAVNKLRRINSEIRLEAIVADLEASNVLNFIADVDLIVDGDDHPARRDPLSALLDPRAASGRRDADLRHRGNRLADHQRDRIDPVDGGDQDS